MSDTMQDELLRIAALLDAANVPRFIDDPTDADSRVQCGATIAERVSLLVRDRDEARKLHVDTAHALANDRQVVADLREQVTRAIGNVTELADALRAANARAASYERVVEAAKAWHEADCVLAVENADNEHSREMFNARNRRIGTLNKLRKALDALASDGAKP